MDIRYALIPNHLTDNSDDQRAVVQQSSKTTEDVIDYIIREGSPITRAEVFAVIEEFEASIAKFLAEGYRVNTSLVQISTSIKGVFEGADDRFDPKRHEVKLNINPGKRIRNTTDNISTEKIRGRKRRPKLDYLKDYATGSKNKQLTPGGSAEISGLLLKFDPEDDDQGIYLIAADGTETKVHLVMRNKPSELIFSIPKSLPAGEYTVEVRAIVRHTTSIRKGKLPTPLIVS